MKKLPYLLLLTCLAGCPTSSPKQPAANTTSAKSNDSRRVGLELLRQAPDATRCWEGLQLLNADLAQRPQQQGPLTPSPEARQALQQRLGLSADEAEGITAPTYRHADAYHVMQCLLLREAARALEVNGATPDELARQALQWVQRHVLLHEQGDDWLPPAQVLRRGYGSRSDQARVFLALVRQLHMEAAILTLPGAPADVVLIGVQPTKSTTPPVYLFDARTGLALRGAAGKVATLDEVRTNPKLLAPVGLTAEQLGGARLRVAAPLEALAPRMADLEFALQANDHIRLHLSPADVLAKLKEASGLPVEVWNGPPQGGQAAPSPTRALRGFLPPEEGGSDKTQRQKRFQSELLPWPTMLLALERLDLGTQLAPQEQQPLLLLLQDLLEKYDLQPRQLLLRGKGEEVVQRYERLRTFLEDENLTGLADNAEFHAAVKRWRQDKLRTAYLALAAKDPQGQALVNNLWSADQYLLTLRHVEGEDRLATTLGRGEDRPVPPQKTILTAIVAYVARDYLNQRALWMRAQVWHDKAEREQLRAVHAPSGGAPAHARSAWINARSAWNLYLDRAAAGLHARQQRLQTIETLLKERDERFALQAGHLLERLHLELHQTCAARLKQAHAVYHVDGAKAALSQLQGLLDELNGLLEKSAAGQPGLKHELDRVLQALRGAGRPTAVRSLELVQNDWTPQGHFYWLHQQARTQRDRWQPPRAGP